MIGHRHGWLGWVVCTLLAVWLGSAAPAAGAGGVVTGEGLIVEKDVEGGLLTLHTGVVLEVTALTKITSAHGRRITMGELVVAPTDGDVVEACDEAMIRYKGKAGKERVSASNIWVLDKIPQ